MDTYVQELISTIEALTDSKQKLQTYMLEQVTLFKSKLQRAEDDNKHLRLALAASKPGTAASPPRTGFRDASLAARVSTATSDAAALRVSGKDTCIGIQILAVSLFGRDQQCKCMCVCSTDHMCVYTRRLLAMPISQGLFQLEWRLQASQGGSGQLGCVVVDQPLQFMASLWPLPTHMLHSVHMQASFSHACPVRASPRGHPHGGGQRRGLGWGSSARESACGSLRAAGREQRQSVPEAAEVVARDL